MENEFKEMEEMRRQLDILKQKLEQRQLVSDRILRRIIRQKSSSIHNRLAAACIIAGFAAIYCPMTFHHIGASWAFCLVTSAFLLAAVGYTLYMRREIRPSLLATGNLVETARRVSRMKRLEHIWQQRIGIPFIIVWFPWLCWEAVSDHDESIAFLAGFIASLALGCAIGGLIGWKMYKRNMRDADEIIEHIKELDEEEQQP